MVDIYTRTRKFDSAKVLEESDVHVHEILAKRGIIEKLAHAETKAEQDKILRTLSAKELVALKKTNWYLMTQSFD